MKCIVDIENLAYLIAESRIKVFLKDYKEYCEKNDVRYDLNIEILLTNLFYDCYNSLSDKIINEPVKKINETN